MKLRFLTLRVAHAARSRAFYEALGLRAAGGDAGSLPMLDAGEVPLMAQATDLEQVEVRKVGDDIMIAGRVRHADGEGA